MEPDTQGAPDYYVWQVAGKPVVVHLHLDVVDGLLAEVMRGFGAVPKRGAEVGGVLLGTIEPGSPAIVRIEDFEPVDCSYKRGPSYLFTDEDGPAFEAAVDRWQPQAGRPAYAVGYFRSHTRDGLALCGDDIDLLDRYFPEPAQVALLVKPFATKASPAGFFFREDGVFQDATPLEFPFRRRDLGGDEPAPRRPLAASRYREQTLPAPAVRRTFQPEEPERLPITAAPPAHPRTYMKGWMWISLLFVFLLLGGLLGFEWAQTLGARGGGGDAQAFSLGLTAAKNDENLMVRWNRDAPAIRAAQRGVLEIQDGAYSKPVELDAAHLESGSIIYRQSSNSVRFRLTVYLSARASVSETLDWKQ